MKEALPHLGDTSLAIEDQARSVLRLLLGAVEAGAQQPLDYQACPNCGGPATSLSSPYCSTVCRDQAAFVRQLRGAMASGAILTEEKQIVFGERLWWLLGGGLPMRESRIPESAKRQVIKRCGGMCEFCGAPFAAIENFGSGCNRPLHLRAVCAACSQTKPYGDPAFINSPPVVTLLTTLSQRVNAPTPLKPCDDPEAWDWRAYVTQRRICES